MHDFLIKSMWVGGPLSNLEKLSMMSFLKHGHRYQLFTYEEIKVPEGVELMDANEIVPKELAFQTGGVDGSMQSWAGFSDLFRYKMLMDLGGWWVDTDFVCFKRFGFLDKYVFTGNNDSISPGLVRVPVGCPMVKWAYETALEKYSPEMKWGGISGLMEQGVRKFDLYKYKINPQWFFPVSKREILGPVSHLSVTTKALLAGANAAHCWNEIWRSEGHDKNKQYDPNCLYELWLREYGIRKND